MRTFYEQYYVWSVSVWISKSHKSFRCSFFQYFRRLMFLGLVRSLESILPTQTPKAMQIPCVMAPLLISLRKHFAGAYMCHNLDLHHTLYTHSILPDVKYVFHRICKLSLIIISSSSRPNMMPIPSGNCVKIWYMRKYNVRHNDIDKICGTFYRQRRISQGTHCEKLARINRPLNS